MKNIHDFFWDFLPLLIFGLILVVAGLVINWSLNLNLSEPEACAKVIQIGSCNREGKCSVRYDNGDRGIKYLPMVGDSTKGCGK